MEWCKQIISRVERDLGTAQGSSSQAAREAQAAERCMESSRRWYRPVRGASSSGGSLLEPKLNNIILRKEIIFTDFTRFWSIVCIFSIGNWLLIVLFVHFDEIADLRTPEMNIPKTIKLTS